MKRLIQSLALLPLTLSIVGCSDAFDLDSFNPLDPGEHVVIRAVFENENGLATIENLRVSWDGETVDERISSTPIERVSVYGYRAGRQRGSHRLSFQIRRQTSSPHNYRIPGVGIMPYNAGGAPGQSLELEPRTALLETNGVITYTFHLD